MSEPVVSETEPTVSINWIFDAPVELLWKVWTSPEHIAKWWGPDGFTNDIENMDVEPGGHFKFVMNHQEHGSFPNLIIYHEVIENEKLTFWHGSGENDNTDETFESEVLFKDLGDQTEVSITSRFVSIAKRDEIIEEANATEGMKQGMYKLAAYLEKLKGA